MPDSSETKYILTIKPAIPPKDKHRIQDLLTVLGYDVHGGGINMDLSCCDISFSKEEK